MAFTIGFCAKMIFTTRLILNQWWYIIINGFNKTGGENVVGKNYFRSSDNMLI